MWCTKCAHWRRLWSNPQPSKVKLGTFRFAKSSVGQTNWRNWQCHVCSKDKKVIDLFLRWVGVVKNCVHAPPKQFWSKAIEALPMVNSTTSSSPAASRSRFPESLERDLFGSGMGAADIHNSLTSNPTLPPLFWCEKGFFFENSKFSAFLGTIQSNTKQKTLGRVSSGATQMTEKTHVIPCLTTQLTLVSSHSPTVQDGRLFSHKWKILRNYESTKQLSAPDKSGNEICETRFRVCGGNTASDSIRQKLFWPSAAEASATSHSHTRSSDTFDWKLQAPLNQVQSACDNPCLGF